MLSKSKKTNIYIEKSKDKPIIINANEETFKLIDSNLKFSYLEKKIIELITKYKLTSEEVSGYLVEQDDINETENEIKIVLNNLLKSNFIKLVCINEEHIIKPITEYRNDQKSRADSIKWINKNTKLNSFFIRSRQIYTNSIKKLKTLNKNFYNRILEPTNIPMQVIINNNKYTVFTSNDYLGLSKHPLVVSECKKILDKYGNGSCGSRILSGTTPIHRNLERTIATFKNLEDAIVFNTGYMTNLALMSIVNSDSIIIFDSLVHASIIDGFQLSKAEKLRFKHNDINDLKQKFQKVQNHKNKIVVIEGVYSMDGDIAKISEIIEIAKFYNALIVIDEAHSIGTMGKTGRGIMEHADIAHSCIDFSIGTLSKSIGAAGGYIAGKKEIIDMLRYFTRQYIFSTSLPPNTLQGAITAFEIIDKKPEIVHQLQKNSQYMRTELRNLNFNIGHSESQIVPIIIGDDEKTHFLQSYLEEEGFIVHSIIYPAVSRKSSRLRITISASHQEIQLQELIFQLKKYGKKIGII